MKFQSRYGVFPKTYVYSDLPNALHEKRTLEPRHLLQIQSYYMVFFIDLRCYFSEIIDICFRSQV